jgi:hypothetical protein
MYRNALLQGRGGVSRLLMYRNALLQGCVDQAAILFCSLFIVCIKCLSENTASLIHFIIGGGYGSIRPLPLVEVNQAILAWSCILYKIKNLTKIKKSGLWIRIDLIRTRIQHFCSIPVRIRIQATTELLKTISFSTSFEIKI